MIPGRRGRCGRRIRRRLLRLLHKPVGRCMDYRPTADEIEAAWAVMHDGAQMYGSAYRLTERALIAARLARQDQLDIN